jgi:hypothetical protein
MSGSSLLLTNGGRSRYREFQVTTSCSFGKQDELNASYVRSRAFGDLNDFNSYYANFKNLIIRRNEQSLLPFDAPNRFVFWGNFSVKYGLRSRQSSIFATASRCQSLTRIATSSGRVIARDAFRTSLRSICKC